MPAKKSLPAPQSDESSSDEETVKIVKKPQKKAAAKSRKNPDEQLEDAAKALFEGKNDDSDGEDDDSDLFALPLPPPPEFLTKPNHENRLMISNVEVENFKSYFGKASIGPFHKSFTSIIGPNGSGKSNLIDSLLFVFGFRANKIRSAKVANLIHKSRGKEPDSCTVTIYFQRIIDNGPNSFTVVEDSKFRISRTAYRNSSSSYAIDGRAASKNEVEARLRLVDIDIEHNRFLILQGEVEQIAMMKPKRTNKNETGMIEYLEDIIGSNRLERFVKLFQRRTDRLLCEQSQQKITREHARASKVAMEDQVRTAIEFLSKENEATTLRMKLNQYKRMLYVDKMEPMRVEMEAKKAEKQEIAVKLDANKLEYKEAEELDKALCKERSALDKEIDALTKELNDLNAEETRRQDTLKRCESDIQKLETEKEKETKKRATLVAAPEKAEKKIEKCKEEVAMLADLEKTANEEADRNLPEFEKRAESTQSEQKTAQKAWAAVNADYNKMRSEATVARDELEDMRKLAGAGTRKLDELRERLAKEQVKLDEDTAEMNRLKPLLETADARLKEVSVELPALRKKTRDAHQEFVRTRDRLEELRQQNSSCSSTNQTIRLLMKEKQEGRIPSFYGRLGDHGFVEPKYDAAISTNYQGRLNWLIVGNEEDCPKILDFLFKNKLPRSTVQPLDRLRVRPENLTPAAPGKYPAPRLIDLIDCEPEMRPAFYDMLRDSIVAETTADAQRMHNMPACRGVTVCTLQGAMIQPSGNFTGGGRPVTGQIVTDRNKKAKQVNEEDKKAEKQLAERIDGLRSSAEELKEQENRMDAEYVELRRQVSDTSNRLAAVTASVQSETPAIATLKKTIAAQEKEVSAVKVDEKELDEKQKIVVELEKKRDKLGEKAEAARVKQDEMQSKLDGLFKELVGCHRDEARDAQQKRQRLEKDIAKETANIANSARNIERCDANIARLEKDIGKKQKKCDELNEQATDEQAIEERKSVVEERQKQRAQLEEQFVAGTKRQSELTDAEMQLEMALKKANEEVMAAKENMQAFEIKIAEFNKQLKGLMLNRIPRFQFLVKSTRPEDLAMTVDDELPIAADENQSPEEMERRKKYVIGELSDKAYAIEFEMRQKLLDNTETFENTDGDKLIPIELLSEEKVREITSREKEEMTFKWKQCVQQIETLKQKVDVSCIDTYIVKVKQFNEETVKLADISANYHRHNHELQRIKKMRLEEFHSAFEFIGKHLVAVFKMLTDGGDAKLEYRDKDDPFKEGINFMVRPAKKAWKQIQFLSGGEKTLSSLALIFALHMFRPTPFYVMDEIDAALDYRNVSIIAQYVRQKTENAQFIIISLRNNMFELANRLVGIYKVDGCTQNVAIDPLAVCHAAKAITDSMGIATCTLPDEVTLRFNESKLRANKEMTAQEKQYSNFPSTSDIEKAEKIVSVEGRVRKQIGNTTASATSSSQIGSRPVSKATDRAVTRAESRADQFRIPAPRLVERPTTETMTNTGRTSRKERNMEMDETTPPRKRSNSNRAPQKSAEKSSNEGKEGENEVVMAD